LLFCEANERGSQESYLTAKIGAQKAKLLELSKRQPLTLILSPRTRRGEAERQD
jgi:hypothetical protein